MAEIKRLVTAQSSTSLAHSLTRNAVNIKKTSRVYEGAGNTGTKEPHANGGVL